MIAAAGAMRPPRRLWREMLAMKMRLWDRPRRYRRLVLEYVDGLPLVVLPEVFNPKLLRSGEFFARYLSRNRVLAAGASVLDLGCGSGVGAIAAARKGCRVVAVDINRAAVRCTRVNAVLNDVDARVEAREGDLFEPVRGERFDVVLFNPPYYRGQPRDALDFAWRAPDIVERFAADLQGHLTNAGFALVVLSSDGAHEEFLRALTASGFRSEGVATRDYGNEVMTVYRVC